jgi:hypothetical protein
VRDAMLAQYRPHSRLVSVGDEHLPEMLPPYHVQQFRDTGTVEFVENIVQQQDRFALVEGKSIVELRQP